MDTTLPYLPKNHQRYLLVFATVFFVLLNSCPVKSSIKSLLGIPVSIEQGGAKNSSAFLGNGCALGEIRDAKISQTASFSLNDLLPAVLFSATFLFLPAYVLRQGERPAYNKLPTRSTLLLFLRYRKLII